MRKITSTCRPLLRKFALGAVLLSLASMGIADEPKSRAGMTALSRFNAAKSKIDAEYRARLSRLKKVLEQELTGAMRSATRAGDLDEANAIKAKLAKVIGTTETFQVDSRHDWQPTVVVTKGSRIVIEAEGQWSADTRRPELTCDANGTMNGARLVLYLEGRIENGARIPIGTSTSLVADASGMLHLRGFDTGRSDNRGSVAAQITVYEP